MWTRELLKKNGWEAIKPNYWMALVATLIISFLSGGSSGFTGGGSGNTEQLTQLMEESDMSTSEMMTILGVVIGVAVFVMLLGIAYSVFVGNVVQVGMPRFFCNAREGIINISDVFGNFKKGRYLNTVKTMFFMNLYVFLWSLLLIIPGIIKTYEYTLVPYLMSQNPNLDHNRALEISKKTMEGEKWNYFVLELSFIGWYLLGILACCIGSIFVEPYRCATLAEFYTCMRAKMIQTGIASESELTEDDMTYAAY